MLGPTGNPQAKNLFEIVSYLQRAEGVRLEVPPAAPHWHEAAARIRRGL